MTNHLSLISDVLDLICLKWYVFHVARDFACSCCLIFIDSHTCMLHDSFRYMSNWFLAFMFYSWILHVLCVIHVACPYMHAACFFLIYVALCIAAAGCCFHIYICASMLHVYIYSCIWCIMDRDSMIIDLTLWVIIIDKLQNVSWKRPRIKYLGVLGDSRRPNQSIFVNSRGQRKRKNTMDS